MNITVVLGAGSSRGVSYNHQGKVSSPLDSDFFDLLQRLEPSSDEDQAAVEFILKQCLSFEDYELRRSMERMFYTLHLRSYLQEKLLSFPEGKQETDQIVSSFARAVQSLLRNAHGMKHCRYHCTLLRKLTQSDTIISFNYDLVTERALKPLAERHKLDFSSQIYGFDDSTTTMPLLLKLHGSSNWKLDDEAIVTVRQQSWSDFDSTPGYRGHKGEGTVFPIMLPFWDKHIEEKPWRQIWSKAYERLQSTSCLVVWGYSLALTDVKSRELFRVSLRERGKHLKLCVIDPASETRNRWRTLLPNAQFWEYERFADFKSHPPTWWGKIKLTVDKGRCPDCEKETD